MNRCNRFAVQLLIGTLTLPAASGCSYLFVSPPPSNVSGVVPAGQCTSSKLAPVVDTVFGSLEVLRTGIAASADDSVYADPDAPLSREADVGLGLAFSALFLSSAIYGYYETSECTQREKSPYVERESDDSEPTEVDDSFTPAHPSPRAPSPATPSHPTNRVPATPTPPPPAAPAPSAAPPAEPAPAPVPANSGGHTGASGDVATGGTGGGLSGE